MYEILATPLIIVHCDETETVDRRQGLESLWPRHNKNIKMFKFVTWPYSDSYALPNLYLKVYVRCVAAGRRRIADRMVKEPGCV